MANKYTGRGRDESALGALRDASRGQVEGLARGRTPGMNTAGNGLLALALALVVVGAFWFAVARRQGLWTVYVGLALIVAAVPPFVIGARRNRRHRRAELALARQIEEDLQRPIG